MIVVSDTSALTNLAAVGRLDLFHALYGEVHISEAVWQELNAEDQHWPGRDEVASADWIHRHPLAEDTLVKSLLRDLDRGESESIVLAMKLGATLIILDDQAARDVAEHLGLNVVGLLGVLLEAKARQLIEKVMPVLDMLRNDVGFYVSQRVYERVKVLAGE